MSCTIGQARGRGPARFSSVRTPRSSTRARSVGRDPGPSSSTVRRSRCARRRRASMRAVSRTRPAAPLAGVIEQVAQQLGEIAAIADKLAPRARSRARATGPCRHTPSAARRAARWRPARRPPAPAPSSAPPEAAARLSWCSMMPRMRSISAPSVPAPATARSAGCAHHRERRLQTVGEIAERVAIARDALALTDEQRVEIRRRPRELARIAAAELSLRPSSTSSISRSRRRTGASTQRNSAARRQQQRQHEADEPAEQLAPEPPQLLLVGRQAHRDAEGERSRARWHRPRTGSAALDGDPVVTEGRRS